MENVPKIVRTRLQRLSSKEHPDADLLTAFAERALGAAEREPVASHLSQCRDCREVVALALPAREPSLAPQATRPTRGAWFGWPAFRWSAVAAGVLLVASAGILQYQHRSQQNDAFITAPVKREQISTALQHAEVEAPPPREKTAPKPAKGQAKQESTFQKVIPTNQPPSAPNVLVPRRQSAGEGGGTAVGIGSGYGGGIGRGVFRPQRAENTAPATSSQLPASSSSSSFAASPKAPVPASPSVAGAPAQNQTMSEGAVVAQNQAGLQPQARRNSDVVKAKEAPALPVPSAALGLGSAVLWSISSAGALQRSFDDGAVWEVVAVSTANTSNSRMMVRSARQDSLYKKNTDKEASAVFRCVTASGAEVWAGGSEALLVHSLDAGNHWVQVVPAEANVFLTGDVVAIEFTDAQHGKISTSTAEVWATRDDGQTWHKQ